MPMFFGAITGVLVMDQSWGNIAIDLLAAIGVMDPKQGVTLLLAILFYSKIFTRKDINYQNMLVSFPVFPLKQYIKNFFLASFIYQELFFDILILAAETFGNASVTCFTFCNGSTHSSDYPANASEGWKTVCTLYGS